METSNKVVVVDNGEDARVSKLKAGEGIQGAGTGKTGGGDEM